MQEYWCRQVHHVRCLRRGPAALELEPEAFFAVLVSGWQHLIDADPRVLSWLVDYQRPLLSIPDYPVDGTPSVLVKPGTSARGGRSGEVRR